MMLVIDINRLFDHLRIYKTVIVVWIRLKLKMKREYHISLLVLNSQYTLSVVVTNN